MALATNTFVLTNTAANGRVSIDPAGSLSSPVQFVYSVAPVVTNTTALDRIFPRGQQNIVCSFTSTQAGCWEIAAAPDNAVLSVATDRKSATITFSHNASKPGMSEYVAARCFHSPTVHSVAVNRVHIGATGIIKVGAGVGYDYANWDTAHPNVQPGNVVIIKDGTYTDKLMAPSFSRDTLPPNGVHTANSSGQGIALSVVVDVYTTVMAETPFGVVYDAQFTGWNFDTQDQPIIAIVGILNRDNEPASIFTPSPSGSLNPFGRDVRCLVFQGLVVKNAGSSGFLAIYTDHIIFRYVAEYDTCRPSGGDNPNVGGPFSMTYVSDCMLEYANMDSSGRAGPFVFQCWRTIRRRYITRKGYGNSRNTSGAQEPFYGAAAYLSIDDLNHDNLHIDYDSALWDFSGAGGGSVFNNPATNGNDYPKRNKFKNCFAVECDMSFMLTDAYDVPDADVSGHSFDNMVGYKCIQKISSTEAIVRGGPITSKNLRLFNCGHAFTTASASLSINAFRRKVLLVDAILNNLGWSEAAGDSIDFGSLVVGDNGNPETNIVEFVNGIVNNFKGPVNFAGDSAKHILDYVTDIDPLTNGIMYLDRIEEGSVLAALGYDTQSFNYAVGEAGTLHDDANSSLDYETGVDWIKRMFLDEKVIPLMQAYAYVGSQGTFSGKRGMLVDNTRIDEEIRGKLGNTPYQSRLLVTAGNGAFIVTIGKFSSKFETNVTARKVVINGLIESTLNSATHTAEFRNMVPGHQYKVQVSVVDSVTGESGLSDPVFVTT